MEEVMRQARSEDNEIFNVQEQEAADRGRRRSLGRPEDPSSQVSGQALLDQLFGDRNLANMARAPEQVPPQLEPRNMADLFHGVPSANPAANLVHQEAPLVFPPLNQAVAQQPPVPVQPNLLGNVMDGIDFAGIDYAELQEPAEAVREDENDLAAALNLSSVAENTALQAAAVDQLASSNVVMASATDSSNAAISEESKQ